MRFNQLKSTLNTAVLAVTILLLGASTSFAQSTVALTAGQTQTALPDGQIVPMWGYACGAVTGTGASCAAANPNASGNWSPVVITVAPGPLTITLTNALPAPVAETSLVIVGQLGGGLGAAPSTTPSPAHNPQGATWPIAGTPGGGSVTFTPPPQADRVQSFATHVANGATLPLPTWANLKPGTYLIESGTHPSIQGTMGLYGVLVVTTAPTTATPLGTAYPVNGTNTGAVTYNAEVPLVFSEIDPVQNAAVALAVTLPGFSETTVWSGQPGGCGNPSTTPVTGNCYPPAVNYDPRYYLINGVSLDRTNLLKSLFAANPTVSTGTTLVRIVNAGSRMHVPSMVGPTTGAVPGFSLIAEDGNVLPGVPRVQSEVFMAAGKTYDLMIDSPATAKALPIFDRELSLSSNNQRDGGMTAYIGLDGAAVGNLPTALSAVANPDSYFLVPGAASLTISDPAKGLLANDLGVYGATAQGTVAGLALNADGTFTYTGGPTTFNYCGNGSATLCAQVTIAACTGTCLGGAPTANPDAYTSNLALKTQIAPPGVLENDTDPQAHPLTAALVTGSVAGGTVTLNPDGSFTAAPTTPPTTAAATVTFQYTAVNSQSTASAAAMVTVTFNPGSGLQVHVLDAPSFQVNPAAAQAITDYRWIIEEDRTFDINPYAVNTGGTTVPSFGTNFHTSYMPVVAAGCVGVAACEAGQTLLTVPAVCDIGNGGCRTGTGVSQQDPVDPKYVHLDPTKRYYISILPGDAGNDFTAGGGAPTNGSLTSITRNGKTITGSSTGVNGAPTGLNAGDTITLSGSSDPKSNGVCKVTSVTDTTTTGHFVCTLTTPLAVTGTSTTSNVSFTHQFSIAEDCGTYSSSANAWAPGSGTCGHGMGGANIAAGASSVNVTLEETPFATAKIAVFVFEDDSPLNGENDVHGGTDSGGTAREPGLGGFEITLFDDAGGSGDATGQMTYDMFNYPLSNSLANTVDQLTGQNACPITTNSDSLIGMIVTCPNFEDDGVTVSPLAGQAVIANMMPGRYGVVANEGADRAGRGEEWLQTNTLDGQKAHDSFMKIGGPAYFQEFGPAGFHVSIGFANPKIINARLAGFCAVAGSNCTNKLTGLVTDMHQSRTPDQRLYSSGDRNALGFTQCYVSVGDPDDDDFAFTKCDSNGNFSFSGLPDGNWRITIFDQWNDQIVDGLSTPVSLSGGKTVNMEIPVQQWHTNIYTRSYIDVDKNGVSSLDTTGFPCTGPNTPANCNANFGNATEPGLTLLPTNIRFRDGSYSNFNNTDLNGFAGFNEIFPLFNWYVIEADTTRFKQTGVHVVYDAGGPVDGNGGGTSNIASSYANTIETNPLPADLRFPGSVYCGDADCIKDNLSVPALAHGGGPGGSTGRIDPPWVTSEAWQGYIGENEFVEFGKTPFADHENGGIHGEVTYASTRPFDDPSLLIHTSWTPNVPNVKMNLYQEIAAADGTTSLKLVDTTFTTSWDDWAQGFRAPGVPNMNCPGQDPTSLFFFTLKDSTEWLNSGTALLHDSQFKCYDGLSNFNQVQPAPYDGYYHFPSVTSRNLTTGAETGTNCSICVANPTGDGTHMLPKGKYVVEMIVPPGYELVKEEDKNILIGDNYIAPVTQQFGGLGSIFILPDQAEVASRYNANNPNNPTNSFGRTTYPSQEGDTGSVETFWPCVGLSRTVPDFISLFPQSAEVAPFAGATRNLCDRKEVNLDDQTAPLAKFWVFSSTHVAAHFTGIMLDDLSSEFDPFSPQFGEKFAIPNAPISFKDHYGIEVSRTYSDEWGLFNGLNYSTWEVNPPNPTGYAPTMMVACMNDPGPIVDTRVGSPTNGQMITDPLFNPNYSQFCYEIPFMPGQTQYMDTPVVPTAAFADGYNLPDCAYPAATPAIASVVSPDAAGPYVSAAGHSITINSLGDQSVPNQAYSGPSAKTTPFNQKFITRHYGFGAAAGTVALLGQDGNTYPLSGVSWSDTQITGTVNVTSAGHTMPACLNGAPRPGNVASDAAAITKWGQCGELVITTAPSTAYPKGQQSIDTVTVTVGGSKAPTVITAENAASNAVQTALDAAAPGDLIILGPGNYNEMLLMWKPVRLQGVGAASVSVNANTHPSGKMDTWRHKVDCLFGLSLNGGNIGPNNPFDPSGANSCAFVSTTGAGAGLSVPQVDPLPLEPIAGWDPSLNGNIAELLQEPTLMGAYEGAAITVLGKGTRGVLVNGVRQYDPNCTANGICTPLTNSSLDCSQYPSNFLCNPSRVDGISFVNSSQGGGGIFLHGYNHYTEVSNNRVHSNGGTLSGGITVGQAETPDGTIAGTQELAFGFNLNTNVHNNSVTQNSSYGDEINSSTTMAAGGVTFCTGADNYKFNHNWVCGNLSTGDGGGFVHFGLSYNGNISNNYFLFNQSNNISLDTNGGGLVVMGAPPDGTVCENSLVDVDCPPQLSDGAGPGTVIDSNLFLGNTAESGSGGGIRLQNVNGTDVVRNPRNSGNWYGITVTNNIISNNVAGWDGAGISIQDALKVSFINNTVVDNDSTASAGVLFNTLGAPMGNNPPPQNGGGNCDPNTDPNCTGNQIVTSSIQPAGLVTNRHTPNLAQQIPSNTVCPSGFGYAPAAGTTPASCLLMSSPKLQNDLFWQNRPFHIQVGGLGTGPLNQQNLVTLLPQISQATTGACVDKTTGAADSYWDIGVRGDTGPANHSSGFTLTTTASILSTTAAANPAFIRQYCNGSRTPPENGGLGYDVPPGIADATTPNPIFNLTPAATVDEGNNWINMAFGPLSLVDPTGTTTLGNYAISTGSTAIDHGSNSGAPNHDFFGTVRPQNTTVDIGAVEFVGAAAAPVASVTGGPLAFGNVATGSTSAARTLTLHNTGNAPLTGITYTFTAGYARATGGGGGTCPASGGSLSVVTGTCTINVVFTPTAAGASTGSLTIGGNAAVSGSPVGLSGTGVAPVRAATLTPTSWNAGNQVRNCPGTTTAQQAACAADPAQTFTLTNTGNVTLTGVGMGALGGTNANAFATTAVAGRCGTAGNTSIAPGGTCSVRVAFRPLTANPAGIKNATISVTDSAGTQTSTLTGNAQ